MNIILASNSPRRRDLLQQLGLPFTVRTMSGIDEHFPAGLSHEDTAIYIARAKAEAYRPTLADDELLITADTIVCIDDCVLGKPVDAADASRMLHLLSGRTHEVVTGVTLLTRARRECFAVTTRVTFAPLTDGIIDHYITHYKPFDKAGAYGIQEWIGCVGVARVEGSFYNVIGLPLQRLYAALRHFLPDLA